MSITLKEIKLIVEVAKNRTMSEAAIFLGVRQPTISEAIKNIEEIIGQKIFYRTREGIALTSSGREFVEKGSKILNGVSELIPNEITGKNFGSFVIHLGCHSTVGSYTLPSILKNLVKESPDYNIEVEHNFSRNIQYEVQKGKIDVGIVINPSRAPDLVLKKLADDYIHVWAASDKSFDKNRLFADLNLNQTQGILRKWSNAPPKITSIQNFDLLTRLVLDGQGYGILPERAVHLVTKSLTKLDSLPKVKDEIYLVYRPEFGRLAHEKNLIKIILSSLKFVN